MDSELVKAIESQLRGQFDGYFSSAWRKGIGSMIEEASKFNSLVEWINEEIAMVQVGVNANCPADRCDGYTRGNLTAYLTFVQKLAVLVHFRELLLDERTTEQMRENIAYTLEKLYNVRYSEYLKEYI